MSRADLQHGRRNVPHGVSNLVVADAGTPVPMSDPLAGIVAGCRLGNRHAQRLLYDRCHERLYRLIARMVEQQDAADLLQQVFLQIFVKIGQFSGSACFETWAYRLAINECLQFRRRKPRTPCDMPADEPIDPSASHTERTQHQELVELALSQLKPELRAIFVLREIEGLSYREIAAALQIEQGTVGSRLNQARSQLRKRLIELGWTPKT
jgi:RNA polymerase sigma-70 factor (ECF subfamily)